MRSFGALYVADGATLQAVTSTPGKMVGFTTAGDSSQEQGDVRIVPVAASDKITLSEAGYYKVTFFMSGVASAVNETVQAVLRQEQAEIVSGQCKVETETANEPFCMGFVTVIQVTPAQVVAAGREVELEIYLETSQNSNVTPVHAAFIVESLA